MFNSNEYQQFCEYMDLQEFSLTEIAQVMEIELCKAVTYLSKYLKTKSNNN